MRSDERVDDQDSEAADGGAELGTAAARTETVGPAHPPTGRRTRDRTDSPSLPRDHRLADRYVVERVLGRGGYAVVYLARDLVLGQEVALKVLRADRLGPRGYARLKREAAVARQAESPHLVRIHDLGQEGETVFLIMEHVAGGSLEDRLGEGPLAIEEVVDCARQILAGLAALHARGIVHRDVKPANVLRGAGGRLKLADFGLARPWESRGTRLTETAAVVGTVEYLSPEQAFGEEVDPRSDLYSLGVVLWELLAGRPPHEGRSSLEALIAQVTHQPDDVRKHRPETPAWLAGLVARLLEKRPENRFPSAGAVLDALEQRRSPWSPRRRRRLAWAGAAAIAAAAVAGLALWGSARHQPRFSHLVADPGGPRAVAADGSLLWKLPGRAASFAVARLEPGGPPQVVGFDVAPGERAPGKTHRLLVLDAETGRELRAVELPSGRGYFPGFSEEYAQDLSVMDLDGDGGDEVLVNYGHIYWPSYTVLWEPRIDRRRLLLVASGHHRPLFPADVDGDGRRDLLFGGFANRMGWYNALAAVALEPAVNDEPNRRRVLTARTPDRERGPWQALHWYTLLPPGSCPGTAGCLEVHQEERIVRLQSVGGEDVVVGFDGFVRGPRPKVDAAAREATRQGAYRNAAEAQRLLAAGDAGAAGDHAELAVGAAEDAGDPVLAEWSRRLAGQALVQAGRTADASAFFTDLVTAAGSPVDVAFDAARAFHLAGDLEEAIGWYRHGFGSDPIAGLGRHRYELLEGLVFALGELGRWDEAEEVARRLATHDGQQMRAAVYESWVAWRRGLLAPEPPIVPNSPDVDRYLHLEVAHQRGAGPGELLARLDRELPRASETEPLLLSLRALALEELGRSEEALDTAERAWRGVRAESQWSTVARAHRQVVAERYAALLEASGRAGEAAAVRAEGAAAKAAP